MKDQLRDYQLEAVAALPAYFAKHAGNPIIVAPTGSGKSHVIADFSRYAREWQSRLLVVSHVKEIVEQDFRKLRDQLGREVGINAAGLGRREVEPSVLCAQVQSIYRNAEVLAKRDLIIVDECHLVPFAGRGMYRTLLETALDLNPYLKVIGFTATPYRMRGGWLHGGDGSIFTHIAHSIDVVRLIDEGWLAPLVAKETDHQIPTDGLQTVRGDFEKAALEKLVDDDERVTLALDEVCARGANRRSWLVFACSVAHAQHVQRELRRRGIRAELVTGETPKDTRDRLVRDFRDGLVRCLVNVNVLTTGFDAPQTDLLVVLRPTKSPVLYVQMMGRGMRIAPGKTDCLVLDFGGNVARHGPVNAIQVPTGSGCGKSKGFEPAPSKVCPECGSRIHAALLKCEVCDYVFPEKAEANHDIKASDRDIVERKQTVAMRVEGVKYRIHVKEGKPDSMAVDYLCGFQYFTEWVCFEHTGYASEKAAKWWGGRATPVPLLNTYQTLPASTAEAVSRAQAGELRQPEAIWIRTGGKYTEVRGEAPLDVVPAPTKLDRLEADDDIPF